jgi:lipoprotein NlpD
MLITKANKQTRGREPMMPVVLCKKAMGDGWRTGWLFVILSATLLAACSSAPPATVADRQQPPSRKIVLHTVSDGETLYSIAWRYGLDFRTLARHNGIGPPYTIYQAQKLRLDVGDASQRKPPPAIAARERRPAASGQTAATVKRSNAKASVQAGRKRATNPAPKSAGRSKNQTAKAPPPSPPAQLTGPVRWRWPARGKVIGGFSSGNGLNKGIDIDGKVGDSVMAAGAGRVVYAGTGLRGYGKLVIVKHNQDFLSAYAHNQALLVKEGDTVKVGQQIATLGSSGTDRHKLHFEIRRDGKPVNPLTYLPKR